LQSLQSKYHFQELAYLNFAKYFLFRHKYEQYFEKHSERLHSFQVVQFQVFIYRFDSIYLHHNIIRQIQLQEHESN
jgi:hypothetical protein